MPYAFFRRKQRRKNAHAALCCKFQKMFFVPLKTSSVFIFLSDPKSSEKVTFRIMCSLFLLLSNRCHHTITRNVSLHLCGGTWVHFSLQNCFNSSTMKGISTLNAFLWLCYNISIRFSVILVILSLRSQTNNWTFSFNMKAKEEFTFSSTRS